MSEVRGCDGCGKIFALNGDGWSTGTMMRVVKVDGRRTSEQVTADYCAPCTDPKSRVWELSGDAADLTD